MSSDSELIIQFQQHTNREQVFTQLMQKHQAKVYHQIKRMVLNHDDADDVAQIVWIKIWDKLDGFKMESEFTTWLFRIAYNETLNFIAKEKRKATSSFDQDNGDYETHSSQTDAPKSTEIQIQLEQGIKQLPEKQRFVFMLRYFDELNYEKIASITGTTVGGAKANYHQAIKKLEQFIKGH